MPTKKHDIHRSIINGTICSIVLASTVPTGTAVVANNFGTAVAVDDSCTTTTEDDSCATADSDGSIGDAIEEDDDVSPGGDTGDDTGIGDRGYLRGRPRRRFTVALFSEHYCCGYIKERITNVAAA